MPLHTLVITRYRVGEGEAPAFRERARDALEAFAATTGFVGGRIGRATDDPGLWALELAYRDVGSYRRALSAFDVKVRAVPLLAQAVDEPTAYEVLDAAGAAAGRSDLAADARVVGVGEASAPVVPTDLD